MYLPARRFSDIMSVDPNNFCLKVPVKKTNTFILKKKQTSTKAKPLLLCVTVHQQAQLFVTLKSILIYHLAWHVTPRARLIGQTSDAFSVERFRVFCDCGFVSKYASNNVTKNKWTTDQILNIDSVYPTQPISETISRWCSCY